MIDLEILDQVERMNRWKNGIERYVCGGAEPLGSTEGRGVLPSRFSLGGVWIDSDSFLFGVYLNVAYHTYRYTLSTNTILAIGEGPYDASNLVQEQASGIIWQQGGTSHDVQTYNETTHAWTVVLALAERGYFAYDPTGILYFKDSSANYYTCINGTMTVCGAPAGVAFPTFTSTRGSYPNQYRYFYASAIYAVQLQRGEPNPLVIKNHAGTVKNCILLWHPLHGTIAFNAPDQTMIPMLGLTTTPFNTNTWEIYQGANAGNSCQLYGDWTNALITRAFPDLNLSSFAMVSCMYNMNTDSHIMLPTYHTPSSQNSNISAGTNGHCVPCVARNYGSYLSVWTLGCGMIYASFASGSYRWNLTLYRFDIPLR